MERGCGCLGHGGQKKGPVPGGTLPAPHRHPVRSTEFPTELTSSAAGTAGCPHQAGIRTWSEAPGWAGSPQQQPPPRTGLQEVPGSTPQGSQQSRLEPRWPCPCPQTSSEGCDITTQPSDVTWFVTLHQQVTSQQDTGSHRLSGRRKTLLLVFPCCSQPPASLSVCLVPNPG